jgi:hypothetical protein
MKARSLLLAFGLTGIVQSLGVPALAQDRPQKGAAVDKTDLRRETKTDSQGPFSETFADVWRREHKTPLLTPLQMTEAFLELDRNHDMALTRSELPPNLAALRARFAQFDVNNDHRLTYSEFADYVDATPEEMARLPRCMDCIRKTATDH